ncbi:MAG: UDP-N-acetylmuramoyl-L-alanine--D-glutamate ligase [Firmicutes bacterium]|nr:UDP-N-acetylmuramoyl-L-alanine--D-glutamate ligase [Bacillota bacterium]
MKYELKNKKFIALGAGISGISAARFALQQGAEVTLYDANAKAAENKAVQELCANGVRLLCGEANPSVEDWDLAVKSPGIPPEIPFVRALKEHDIPVIGELELAFCASKVPYIAITGTNGKTTTTSLTYEIIKKASIPSFLGGNIGIPLAEAAVLQQEGYIVAEVSSFQLEDSPSFHPYAAAVLNVTPDHLNRHGTMENYTAIKRSIIEKQIAKDFAILNYDDETVRGFADFTAAKVLYFSAEHEMTEGAFVRDGKLIIRYADEELELLAVKEMQIKGKHNIQNALAAALLAFCAGAAKDSIAAVLREFRGVEHRQEIVRELNGITYINDSKATNPDSSIKALEAFDSPLVLIAGGMDKKISFREMLEIGKARIKALVLLGETEHMIEEEAKAVGIENIFLCGTDFEAAVRKAASLASAGDIVLLSPACASWDMFKSYEVRGRLFKDIVNSF